MKFLPLAVFFLILAASASAQIYYLDNYNRANNGSANLTGNGTGVFYFVNVSGQGSANITNSSLWVSDFGAGEQMSHWTFNQTVPANYLLYAGFTWRSWPAVGFNPIKVANTNGTIGACGAGVGPGVRSDGANWTIETSSGTFGKIGAGGLVNTDYAIVIGYDNSTRRVYVWQNGTLIGNATTTCVFPTSTNQVALHSGGGEVGNVTYKNFCVWDNVTGDQSYNCFAPPPGVTPAPNWTAPTPASGSTNNTNVTLNATCAGGNRTYLWFGTASTPATLVITNATSGVYNTSVNDSTTTYYYVAECWDASGGFSANSTTNTWTFDSVSPSIVINPLNEFNAANYSLQNPYDGTVNLNLTFNDDHSLYGYNINVTRGGTVYYNETNTTLTGLQGNYTKALNATTWPVGIYNISIEVDDSHTAHAIRDYMISADTAGLRFTTDEGNDITINSLNGTVTPTTTKRTDRYSFRFRFADGQTKSRSFLVHSAYPIEYLPNSTYKAHFVVLSGSSMRGNWIDFEGVPGTPRVRKINDKNYVVTFDTLASDVEFQSIGGLNVVMANYTFYVGNYSTFAPFSLVGEQATLSLNVTTTPNIANITAYLTYNGTNYTPIMMSNASLYQFSVTLAVPNVTVNVTYDWIVNVTQGDLNGSLFDITGIQQVSDWSITSCGTPFINFTQYDEDNPTMTLPGTFQINVTYWVGNRSAAKLYNQSFTNATSWQICFSPTNGTFYADIYAQNTVVNGFTHRYYNLNGTYTNVTSQVSIYNAQNTSLATYSDLKITTRYVSSYGYFKNVYAKLLRLYLGNGVWLPVQYDKSGDYGLLFYDIKEQSTDYKIRFYDANNSLLKETDQLKFVCTSGACELTQLLTPNGTTTTTAVTSNFGFNNATNIYEINWTGSATSNVNLSVTKLGSPSSTIICSTQQTGVAGSFDCNVTSYTGTIYATVEAAGVPINSSFLSIPRESLGHFLSQQDAALFAIIIIITIVGFGMVSPIAVIITTMLGLIVVMWFGVLLAVTVPFVAVAGVIGFVIAVKVKQ